MSTARLDLDAAPLRDQAPQPLCERHAARVDADEGDVVERLVLLDDLVSDPGERALDRVGVEEDLLRSRPPGSTRRARRRAVRGVHVHRSPFRPLRTELKGFGSGGTWRLARTESMVPECAPRRFTGSDLLREALLRHPALAPGGSAAVLPTGGRSRAVSIASDLAVPGAGTRSAVGGQRSTLRPPLLAGRTNASLPLDPFRAPAAMGASLGGGEAAQLAELEGGVGSAEWAPDGASVLALAASGEHRFIVSDRRARRRGTSPT